MVRPRAARCSRHTRGRRRRAVRRGPPASRASRRERTFERQRDRARVEVVAAEVVVHVPRVGREHEQAARMPRDVRRRTTKNAVTGSAPHAPAARRSRTRYRPLGQDASVGIVTVDDQRQPSSSARRSQRLLVDRNPSARHTVCTAPLSRTTSTSTVDPSPDACNATASPGRTLCGQQYATATGFSPPP